MRWVFLWLVITEGLPVFSGELSGFHGSEAYYRLRRDGYELIEERLLDINGDGFLDALVVEKSEAGIGLSAWKAEKEGDFGFLNRSATLPASALESLVPIKLDPAESGFLLDVFEDSPDEADHWLRLFLVLPTGVRQVFEASYQIMHSEEDAGRAPVQIVDLGGISPGIEWIDSEKTWPKILVYNDPKKLSLPGDGSQSVWFIIGIRERAFDGVSSSYMNVQERYVDYLPKIEPRDVKIDPGAPTDGRTPIEPTVLVDGKLNTEWLHLPRTSEKMAITMTFNRPEWIRMIRLVPGCGSSKERWEKYNRVGRFSIILDKEMTFEVSRNQKSTPVGELTYGDFSLPGSETCVQTMAFFKKPLQSRIVKIVIEESESNASEQTETCISEISVHQARIDQQLK